MNAMQQLLTEHMAIWTAANTEKKSGRGRSSGNAGSVYGIKKLRELILELAVRGKLVPQNVNDEPASELLKRIQAEKAKLVADGKIKQDKPLVPVIDDEKPFDLPRGWAYSRLGDAVEIIRGITFPGSEKTKTPEKGRVACLRTTNVQDQIEWDDLLYIREEFVSREDQILMPRDIVMSMANSRELVGKVALVGAEIHQKTSFGGFLGVLRPFLIEPRFIMALLRTPHTREALIDSASQTTNIANISLAKLRPLFFAIPPLAEQHRIVAKVDELMALCDQLEAQYSNAAEAHEKLVNHLLGTLTQSQNADDFSANWQRIYAHFDVLFTTETSIDALKQTLLQLAVMGKLVSQDPTDEPASELLKRIQAEKAKLVAEGNIKKEKPLVAIADDEKPFELTKSWEWIKLETIAQVGTGTTPLRTKPEYFNPATISWVTSGETSSSYIYKTEQYVSPLALKETNLTVYPKSSLIVAMYGQGKTRGQITELMIEACTNQACAAIRLYILDKCHRKYVKLFFEKIYDEIRELSAGGAQPNLNLSKVKETLIPLPPLAEQHRIVAKVDALMALCDQLKTRIQQANQQQQTIADVLVAQALD